MEWQSIETAPKDGTEVLVYDAGMIEAGMSTIQQAYWHRDRRYLSGGEWRVSALHRSEPSHWMPLPSPPVPATPASSPTTADQR